MPNQMADFSAWRLKNGGKDYSDFANSPEFAESTEGKARAIDAQRRNTPGTAEYTYAETQRTYRELQDRQAADNLARLQQFANAPRPSAAATQPPAAAPPPAAAAPQASPAAAAPQASPDAANPAMMSLLGPPQADQPPPMDVSMGGPSALRQGLGTRNPPSYNYALASLGRQLY